MSDEKYEEAAKQARAQFESIKEMMEEYNNTKDSLDFGSPARDRIFEDALSVEVRSDWRVVGREDEGPIEYRILLCTGGPAVQVVGELNEHSVPTSAKLQCQDWFIPWTNVALSEEESAILLEYARMFYYGE